MELRAALSTIPAPIGKGMWTDYTCPRCDGEPVGGWEWWTEPGTWQERLHLSLRCARRHTWSVSTDMG